MSSKNTRLKKSFPKTYGVGETKETPYVSVYEPSYNRMVDRGLMFQLLLDERILSSKDLDEAKTIFYSLYGREFLV